MKHSPQYLQELRDRTVLSALIGGSLPLVRKGREYWGLCPFHSERTASFSVNDAKQFYHCFGCGEHGDAIGFLTDALGHSFLEAVEILAVNAGLKSGSDGARRPLARLVPPPSPEEIDQGKQKSIERSQAEVRKALPPQSTPVQLHLASRGLVLPDRSPLRYTPACEYWSDDDPPQCAGVYPAMTAAVKDVTGQITGIHQTYLRPEGGKADVPSPRKMHGKIWGGAVRFAAATESLALAEGLETALSVAQSVPGLPVWAVLSLNNLAGSGVGRGSAHPSRQGQRLPSVEPDMDRPGIILPPCVRWLVLCVDSDNGDPESAECLVQRAATRFKKLGLKVRIARPPEGYDFNSLLTRSDAASVSGLVSAERTIA